jgi:hypothetical protein
MTPPTDGDYHGETIDWFNTKTRNTTYLIVPIEHFKQTVWEPNIWFLIYFKNS